MSHRLSLAVAGAVALAFAAPVSAQDTIFRNIDLSTSPFTFAPNAEDSFTFSFDSRFFFDADPFLVQTTGDAAVTAFGGFLGIPLAPSQSFTSANAEFGPDSFPGFASFPDATRIPFSLSPGDLGLRFSFGGEDFFGFVRTEGSSIVALAFSGTAGQPIGFAAIPEPATWAMLILGFGLVGGAMRRGATPRPRLAEAL